jgi:hypothetical protein
MKAAGGCCGGIALSLVCKDGSECAQLMMFWDTRA